MKKKKESSNPCSTEFDLKSLIHQQSLFFDKLVELIPARFYLPVAGDKPYYKGLSKVAKFSAKKETRENIKKVRRARLDPEKSSTTTLDLLKQSLETDKDKPSDKEDSSEDEPEIIQFPTPSLTYEGLQERLHRKLEELRSSRHAPGTGDISNRAKKREIQQGKRKRYQDSEAAKPKDQEEATAKMAKDLEQASQGFAFTHVKIGTDDERGKKKRKLSKLQALDEAKKLEEAKKDPEKGDAIAKKHSWSASINRAAGIKIHDDPKLINKSIKKDKKKHQKNAEKWKDRLDTTNKLRSGKQHTRSQNIADRIQQKKTHRIAKREKKLMRPGFEGRKEGYLNAP